MVGGWILSLGSTPIALEASTAFADARVSVGRSYRPIVLMFTYSEGWSYPDSYLQYTRTHINLSANFPGKVDQHDLEKFGVLIMEQSKSFIMVQIQGVSKRWRMKLEHDFECTLYTASLFHSANHFFAFSLISHSEVILGN